MSCLNFPFLIIGDYNQVLHPEDKWSLSKCSIPGLMAAREFVQNCGLIDIPSTGPWFTWTNGRQGNAATFEKLDRAMASESWLSFFPTVMLKVLPMQCSDHCLVVLDTHWQYVNSSRTFVKRQRFEVAWLHHQDAKTIIGKIGINQGWVH